MSNRKPSKVNYIPRRGLSILDFIRFGLVSRNEFATLVYMYEAQTRCIRSSLVSEERGAAGGSLPRMPRRCRTVRSDEASNRTDIAPAGGYIPPVFLNTFSILIRDISLFLLLFILNSLGVALCPLVSLLVIFLPLDP